MANKKKKAPSVTPLVTGIHLPPKEKKLLAIHYHPDAIKENIKFLAENAEQTEIKYLFEDIKVIVGWALDRLPLAPPKEKGESASESPSATTRE